MQEKSDHMSESLQLRLLKSISVMLRLFIIDEERFPSAEGRVKYNPIDFQTLRFIDAQPNCRGADIARALGVAPTTVQSALDRLIRKGLVERMDHPESRRAKVHKLTEDGKSLRDAIHRQDMSNMDAILSTLTEEEQAQIVALMEKVTTALDAT